MARANLDYCPALQIALCQHCCFRVKGVKNTQRVPERAQGKTIGGVTMGPSPEDAEQSQSPSSLLPGLTNLHLTPQSPQIHLGSPPRFEPQWSPAPDQAGPFPRSSHSLGVSGG